MCENLIVIGICGVTCGGKTTVATKLCNLLPNSRVISQDDYFLDEDDPRHTWISELNHVNYDIITSLDMEKMHQDLLQIINTINTHKLKVEFNGLDNSLNKKESSEPYNIPYTKLRDGKIAFLIVEGFSIFNYKPMLHLFHLKYYFVLDRDECYKRRKTRNYIPPDCPGYFEKCAWPEHLVQLEEVKNSVKDVLYYNGNSGVDIIEKILSDIKLYLKF